MSTKTPNQAFRPEYQAKIEAHLRAFPDIDAAILAVDLGLNVSHVLACQRRLGLRRLAVNR
jgi:hypothetical protein